MSLERGALGADLGPEAVSFLGTGANPEARSTGLQAVRAGLVLGLRGVGLVQGLH